MATRTMKFIPKDGFGVSESDAERYGTHLVTLIERHGGDVSAEEVYEDAKKKSSPIHDYVFDTDDDEAARLHRVERARKLLQSIEITVESKSGKDIATRCFVHVDVRRGGEGAYTLIETAINDPNSMECLMTQAKREMESFARKYEVLEDLAGVIGAINKALGK